MFLIPGLVIAWYVTDTAVPDPTRVELRRYLFARAHRLDGGWGLHTESPSTVFGTAMNYTALRLLGADAHDPRMVQARATLHGLGGALQAPHWGKFWLSVLGVTPWAVVNPVPAELWLLPDWLPIAPWRWWIHMRQVFLPMSYIASRKFAHPLTPLTKALREELFTQPFDGIDFAAHRNSISPADNYHPKSALLNAANWALVNVWDRYLRTDAIARRAEEWTWWLIRQEDLNSDYSDLGPVNQALNTVACFIHDGPDSYSLRRHRERCQDFLWVSREGMLMNGTNGVQTWDTAFAIQAAVTAGLAEEPEFQPVLTNALRFLEAQQIRENCAEQDRCYRQQRKGAWAFSNRAQGYTVSDCVSEALKAVLELQGRPAHYPQLLSDERLRDAVDTLLTMQNASTGGFSSYEPRRGPEALEALNAAEVFGRIMVEYDYPECTTAVVTALARFQQHDPAYRASDIRRTTARALEYIRNAQRADGSWYGSWGICFTYATMFALEALALGAGETYANSERVRRACKFLLGKQRADGGWGESYRACVTGHWVEHEATQVVQTCWALLALLYAECDDRGALERGIRLVMRRQQPDGGWRQEAIEGVFNKSCMIAYPNYKYTFSVMALGLFARRYGDPVLV